MTVRNTTNRNFADYAYAGKDLIGDNVLIGEYGETTVVLNANTADIIKTVTMVLGIPNGL
jgi:hypothetical protein